MDKKEAIKLLKQSLSKIPELRNLPYDNQDFKLWQANIETIVNNKLATDDYEKLVSVRDKYFLDEIVDLSLEQQNDYLLKLNDYEIALASIKNKYEMFGLEEEPVTKAKQAEASKDYEGRKEKQSLGKEIRKHLEGTPEVISPHIVTVAENFHFQGPEYRAYEERNKSSQFSKQFLILCGKCGSDFGQSIHWTGGDYEGFASSIHPPNEYPHHIGTINLRALPHNNTILISNPELPRFDSDGFYYNNFLKALLKELKLLGFKETLPQKVWQWLKSHKIVTIIMLIAALITIYQSCIK